MKDTEDLELLDTTQTLWVSALRFWLQSPEMVFRMEDVFKAAGLNIDANYLYTLLHRDDFRKDIESILDKTVAQVDWERLNYNTQQWASYGWMLDSGIFPFSLLEVCPESQLQADKLALPYINKDVNVHALWQSVEVCHNINQAQFQEACTCFQHKCYTACALLLISLIEGLLIRSKANSSTGKKKIGAHAGKELANVLKQNEIFAMPGFFFFELLSFRTYIEQLFAGANNFQGEPHSLNRNFLQHGMSKRQVRRKDCLKLFLAYKEVLRLTSK